MQVISMSTKSYEAKYYVLSEYNHILNYKLKSVLKIEPFLSFTNLT